MEKEREKIKDKASEPPVEFCDQLPNTIDIRPMIQVVRGQQVMLDRDLAMLYRVETRALNQAVKRNAERFPDDFMFQLNKEEFENWKSQTVMSKSIIMGIRRFPYAFTEQGIAMLSSVLKSKTAVGVNIRIMRAFVSMRRFIATNAQLFQRLETIEYHQLEMKQHQEVTDKRIDEVFKRLDANIPPMQGIFYDGQVFDAYRFVSDLIRKAKQSIVLIDNYVDDTVLTLLDKREKGVSATIRAVINENQRQGQRCFIGLFDPSVRPRVRTDELMFGIPRSRLERMTAFIHDTCLFNGAAWPKVRERIK